VVGALTLGSSTSHLLRGLADIPWQATIAVTSLLALCAVPAILPVRPGSAAAAAPPLDLGAAWRALRERPLRLTTGSYLAHMWELYAFWAWLPMFFAASRAAAPGRLEAGVVAFTAIGLAGLGGCVAGGVLADRVGRTATTGVAMLVSAACCVASPLAFGAPTLVLVAVLIVWGVAVVADSAQFSAAVTELAEPSYAGSVLTLQLALGFALTIASVRLVPVFADAASWRFALVPLAAGPLLGAIGMLRLRGLPAARLLAGGRR
jgi:predicted MFS family arabinose efflux permease